MLLKEIIERIDKSEGNRNCIDFEALAHELDIHFGYTDVDDKDLRLTSYFLSPFADNGFFCGEALYFFDNEFVAVSCKLSEDTDEEFRWVSREAANTVRNYLLEIDNFEAKLNFCDLKEDHGDGYSISYPDEVIDWSKGQYKGKKFKFIEVVGPYFDGRIKIRTSDGTEVVVDTSEIEFSYHLVNKTKE